jgi:YVTN family beta-propeller protein
MIRIKPILIIGSIVLVAAAVWIFGGRWARAHVNYITAVDDHPLTCWTCHVYTQKDNLIAKVINETYVSPYKLDISKDGNTLYVVGQESNELVVVDAPAGKVLEKIPMGLKPHTVILSPDGQKAYVSNQWADNIYILDLDSHQVVDTLVGGSGPAGMVFSPDGKYLWCVNSYSNNISVFDLENMEERRRLKAGNNPVSAAMTPDGSEVYISSRRSIDVPHMTHPLTELTVSGTRYQRVSDRLMFQDAYIMETVDVTPSGDLVLATLIRPSLRQMGKEHLSPIVQWIR